jgi:phage tail-like protein
MANSVRIDPRRGFNFRVEIDNTAVASFRECTGLSTTIDSVDYREGTDQPNSVRKLTALSKSANVGLKRGVTDNEDLWNWYKNILNGVQDRRNGAIVLQDEQHNDVMRWNFENGWICKYEGPTLNAASNDVAIESIEICHERLELA